MAPAEIYQGGKAIIVIEGKRTHRSKLNGREVTISDDKDGEGFDVREDGFANMDHVNVGSSIALDNGEIVKSLGKS